MLNKLKHILIGVVIMIVIVTTVNDAFDFLINLYSHTTKGKEVAEKMGCEYLGYAYSLPEIKFMYCKGKVETILIR